MLQPAGTSHRAQNLPIENNLPDALTGWTPLPSDNGVIPACAGMTVCMECVDSVGSGVLTPVRVQVTILVQGGGARYQKLAGGMSLRLFAPICG